MNLSINSIIEQLLIKQLYNEGYLTFFEYNVAQKILTSSEG